MLVRYTPPTGFGLWIWVPELGSRTGFWFAPMGRRRLIGSIWQGVYNNVTTHFVQYFSVALTPVKEILHTKNSTAEKNSVHLGAEVWVFKRGSVSM